ncbi:MAG: T9SS type A sorting domain-containing protein, partial [Bacteroidales bacterium]|nr:T9SS type A sorting domain-containing protein [Bacteroidales bacterium]
ISDISGKEVMKQTVNDTHVQLNISNLNQGIYLLFVETIHGKAIKKFTVK